MKDLSLITQGKLDHEDLRRLEKEYVLHSWCTQKNWSRKSFPSTFLVIIWTMMIMEIALRMTGTASPSNGNV